MPGADECPEVEYEWFCDGCGRWQSEEEEQPRFKMTERGEANFQELFRFCAVCLKEVKRGKGTLRLVKY